MPVTYQPGLHPRLPADGLRGHDEQPYHAHPDLIAAANVALALRRPLLLTGEPGCGKTDFAFAAERALRAEGDPDDPGLLEAHVRSDSRASDLLYHYDALARFADAHHGGEADRARAADPRNYIQLLALGKALVSPRLRVVLIDEIDKAPRDLPNDLLRELDQGRFTIPEISAGATPHASRLSRELGREKGDRSRPFTIITSNVERQLPDPFLRRCVFYHIKFPGTKDLERILNERFPRRESLVQSVVRLFQSLRDVKGLSKRPATSELIDWMGALTAVFQPAESERVVSELADRADRTRDLERLGWGELPGLSSLIKLREDLQRLGVG